MKKALQKQTPAADLAALKGHLDRKKSKPKGPNLFVYDDGDGPQISANHPDPKLGQVLLMESIGTTDTEFLTYFISQLANAGSKGPKIDEAGTNFLLSVVQGVEPKDQIEAMLASQMAVVHVATMTFARRLAHCDTIKQQDSAERAFNKLCRTFAAQMEGLRRYRTGGEQRVLVQHVQVNEGGQAIVGTVAKGGASPDIEESTP